jgi:replicative superfamily II helicase
MRELVQDEFRDGLLRVLVTTDTLSVGLNLPVDVVVVASTTVSTGGATGELRSLGLGEIKNRIGRAGRLGLLACEPRLPDTRCFHTR